MISTGAHDASSEQGGHDTDNRQPNISSVRPVLTDTNQSPNRVDAGEIPPRELFGHDSDAL